MKIESAACTHVGRRANNEDDSCIEPDLGLYAVADGMGGYEGGEVAAQIVVRALTQFFERNAADVDVTWPVALDPSRSFVENVMLASIDLANRQVRARRRGRLGAMGSTVAALALSGDRAVVAHVGDTRVYRLRGGALEALTRDHSLLAELRALGMPVPTDRSVSNVITKAIGMDGSCVPDVRVEDVADGDVYLLCSDGLYEPLSEEDVARLLASHERPADAARELCDAAYAAGGSDNITAVVVRVRAWSAREAA